MESFKKWLEDVEQDKQKEKASIAWEKPKARDTQMSRYGFLKKR